MLRGIRRQAFAGLWLLLATAAADATFPGGWIYTTQLTSPHGGAGFPAVASAADGRVAIAWQGLGADGTLDIFVTFRGPAGTWQTVLSAFPVAATDEDETVPAVAVEADGDFVVVWQSAPVGEFDARVWARRFGADGSVGLAFPVSAAGRPSSVPDVAIDAFGNFVVAWRDGDSDSSILAQRFDDTGASLGTPFEVSAVAGRPHWDPSVASSATGQFVVAWTAMASDGVNHEVHAATFGADGALVVPEFRVDQTDGSGDRLPAVAMDAAGNFTVAWADWIHVGATIWTRRYSSDGSALAGETVVTTTAATDAGGPDVAMDADGDFAVAWKAGPSVIAQLFDAGGAPQTSPSYFNWSAPQERPAVAMDADGDFWVGATTGTNAVLGRFTGPEEIDLSVTLALAPDPVVYGTPFSVTATVANHHPGSTFTGIPAIDSAIGRADIYGVPVYSPLHTLTRDACPDCEHPIAPGSSRSITYRGMPSGATGTLHVSASVYSLSHWDTEGSNDAAVVEVPIVCPPGSGGTFVLSALQPSVAEGQTALWYVDRTGGSCGAATVTYTLAGSATPGTDYRTPSQPQSLTWPAGYGQRQEIRIWTLNDGLDELSDQESVVVTLDSVSGLGQLGAPASVAVQINDQEGPPILRVWSLSVEEGTTGSMLGYLSHASERTVSFSVTWSGSAAAGPVAGQDFTPASTQFIFEPGVTATYMPITALLDGLDEYMEFGFPTYSMAVNGIPEQERGRPLIILDRDPPPVVTMITPDATVAEGGSIEVRARLSVPSGQFVEIPLIVEGATGDVSLSQATLTFPPGALEGTATLSVVQDSVAEPGEIATVRLAAPQFGQWTLGTDTSVTVTIPSHLPRVVGFTQAATSAPESGKGAWIFVSLNGPSPVPVTVQLALGGTAATPADYILGSTVLEIPAGETSTRLLVRIMDDRWAEANETVTFTMVSAQNATLGSSTAHSLTIMDDDSGRPRPASKRK